MFGYAPALFKNENNYKLFVTGGELQARTTNKVWFYDICAKEFCKGAEMNQARRNHSVSVMNGTMVVFGGQCSNEILSSAEVLDLKNDASGWIEVNSS